MLSSLFLRQSAASTTSTSSFAAARNLLSVAESGVLRTWLSNLPPASSPKLRDRAVITFSKSSGPGGQNVNKVNTKATLRLELDKAKAWIPASVISNLRRTHFYADASDALVLSSMRSRSQAANADDCYEKLRHTIVQATEQDLRGETSDEQRKRVAGLVRAYNAKRKTLKTKTSEKKQSRSKASF